MDLNNDYYEDDDVNIYFKFCDILETYRCDMNRRQTNKIIRKLFECLDIDYDLGKDDYEWVDENYLDCDYASLKFSDSPCEFPNHKARREKIKIFMATLLSSYKY